MLNLDRHFFPVFDRLGEATAYPSTYNLRLVATSVAIAILAAFEHHRLFGFDPGAGMPVWEDSVQRFHPEDRESTVGTIEQSICERTDFELDYQIVHPDGTIKYIHASGHPVLNPSGALVEFVGTSIDMTELRRAEEARLDAQNKLSHANRVRLGTQLALAPARSVAIQAPC